MTDLYINLNEFSVKKQRVFRLLIYGLLLCVALILLSVLLLISFSSAVEYYVLVMSIYLLLYIYFGWVSFNTKLFVKANESGIVFKFGIRNSSGDYIIWDSIRKVKIGPTYIAFFKKSGRKKRVQLGWLSYSRVVEIKDRVVELCDSKGIPYEIVDFIRYYKKKDKR